MQFVPKPWGREYLAWDGKHCAIWALEIDSGHSTSFHCHLKKNTGLICLSGELALQLISNEILLRPLSKINIFRGRFHRTINVGSEPAILLEVESPVDKEDLLRWEDSYGRFTSEYETERVDANEDDRFLTLGSEDKYSVYCSFKGYTFSVVSEAGFSEFIDSEKDDGVYPSSIYVVLSGGLADPNRPEAMVVLSGDVVTSEVLKKLLTRFVAVEKSKFLVIRKQNENE